MMMQCFCRRIVLFACLWMAAAGPGCATDLSGSVLDYANGTGLGGVEISVFKDGQVIKNGVSDALGSYALSDLPVHASLEVDYVLAGYVQRPTKRNIELGLQGGSLNINLMREDGSAEYYNSVAGAFVVRTRREGSSYESEWKDLTRLGLSPGPASLVVSALKSKLGSQTVANLEEVASFGQSGQEFQRTAIAKGTVGVVDAKGRSFTLKTKAGHDSFKVTETAVLTVGHKTISLGDLKAGDWVQVSYTVSGRENHAAKVTVLGEAKEFAKND